MNSTTNRSGQTIPAVGAPNSYARMLCEERFEELREVQTFRGEFIPVRPHTPTQDTIRHAERMLWGTMWPVMLTGRIYAIRDSASKIWYWEVV